MVIQIKLVVVAILPSLIDYELAVNLPRSLDLAASLHTTRSSELTVLLYSAVFNRVS